MWRRFWPFWLLRVSPNFPDLYLHTLPIQVYPPRGPSAEAISTVSWDLTSTLCRPLQRCRIGRRHIWIMLYPLHIYHVIALPSIKISEDPTALLRAFDGPYIDQDSFRQVHLRVAKSGSPRTESGMTLVVWYTWVIGDSSTSSFARPPGEVFLLGVIPNAFVVLLSVRKRRGACGGLGARH